MPKLAQAMLLLPVLMLVALRLRGRRVDGLWFAVMMGMVVLGAALAWYGATHGRVAWSG
jgi:hypothetical protein